MTILYHIKAVAANPFTILRSTLRAYAIKKMAIRLSDFFLVFDRRLDRPH